MVAVSYQGPEWLRPATEYFYGTQTTPFHRVTRIHLSASQLRLADFSLFTRFRHLKQLSISVKQEVPGFEQHEFRSVMASDLEFRETKQAPWIHYSIEKRAEAPPASLSSKDSVPFKLSDLYD